MFGLHRWSFEEDIVVATHALNRKTDLKTISALSLRLGLSEGKIQYRMSDYTNLLKGVKKRHYSKQERRVFRFLSNQKHYMIGIKPLTK